MRWRGDDGRRETGSLGGLFVYSDGKKCLEKCLWIFDENICQMVYSNSNFERQMSVMPLKPQQLFNF